MKVLIEDNLFPILEVNESPEGNFDISSDLYERYKLAQLEWDAVQDELTEIYEGI